MPVGNLQNDRSQRAALESLLDGTSSSLAAKQDAIIAAGRLGTGSVARGVEDVVGERVSVKNFGATGDGTTDDTAAVASAITAAGIGGEVIFPRGSYRLTTWEPLEGQTIRGGSHNTGTGSIILVDAAGEWLWTPQAARARVKLSNLCFTGLNATDSFLKNNGQALRRMAWEDVTFSNLRYVWDSRSGGGSGASYWFQGTRVRIIDCWHAFDWSDMDECSLAQSEFHPYDAFFEISYTGKSGTFVVGETLTGGTSADTAVIRGIIASSGTAGTLLVTTPDGTNGAPLTIDFAAAETLTGGTSGATATCASVEMSRQCYIEQSGGISFIAVSNNNGSIHFDNCESVNLTGGYWENYSEYPYQPSLMMTNMGAASVNVHLVSGSSFYLDETSYRNVSGRTQTASRYSGEPPAFQSWPEMFPDPSFDNATSQAGLRALAANNMTKTARSAFGIDLASTTTSSSYVECALALPCDAISAAVGIIVTAGQAFIRPVNTKDNTGRYVSASDGPQIVRLASKVGQWRGDWISGTPYIVDDIVANGGSFYRCTAAVSGSTAPGSDGSHWTAQSNPSIRISVNALTGGNFTAVLISFNLCDLYGIMTIPHRRPADHKVGNNELAIDRAFVSKEGQVSLAASGTSNLFTVGGKTSFLLVHARDTAASGSYIYRWFIKNGSTLSPIDVSGIGGSNATLTVSGTTIVLTNTSVATRTYYWAATFFSSDIAV